MYILPSFLKSLSWLISDTLRWQPTDLDTHFFLSKVHINKTYVIKYVLFPDWESKSRRM